MSDRDSLETLNPLVTMTISVARNGDITQSTLCHGNSFADVYRGITQIVKHLVKDIEDRRRCPFNPINKPDHEELEARLVALENGGQGDE